MKQILSHVFLLFKINILLTALIYFSFNSFPSVSAQKCQNPPVNGAQQAWAPGSTVTVNINPATTNASQRQAIQTAFNNWSGTGSSGVTFVFTSNATPITGVNTYQVSIQNPNIGGPCTAQTPCQASTGGQPNGGVRGTAFTYIDPAVTNLNALTQSVSHEIGHTFGLADCWTCPSGSSAMNQANGPNDTTSGLPGPSSCDSNTASTTTGTPTPTPAPSPSPTPTPGDGGGGGDDGGGSGSSCQLEYQEGECGYDSECDRWDPYTATCYNDPGYDWCLPGTWVEVCP